MAEDVDAVMQSIPPEWRDRWCTSRANGGCACMGCVEIGNRLIMTGRKVTHCDPEYIDESKIPPDIYKKYKVTREEWEAWMQRNGPNQ